MYMCLFQRSVHMMVVFRTLIKNAERQLRKVAAPAIAVDPFQGTFTVMRDGTFDWRQRLGPRSV